MTTAQQNAQTSLKKQKQKKAAFGKKFDGEGSPTDREIYLFKPPCKR